MGKERLQYEHLLDKDPTDLHMRFADWISDKTGLDRDEIDEKTLQLAVSLRMDFQRSPENQEHLALAREAAEKAKQERLAAREERAAKKTAAAEAKAKKAAEEPEEDDSEDAEEPAEKPKPAARRRGAAAKKTTAAPPAKAKPAATRRRRGAAAPKAKPEVDETFDEDDDL